MKIFFYICILIISINSGTSAFYSDNNTNLTVDRNGWCLGINITFKVYNQTDWDNQKQINSELCKEDETPEEDDCLIYNYIDDAEVNIYNGPIKGLGLLKTFKTDSNGEFTLRFDSQERYLMEIFPKGQYNDYVELLEIIDCNLDELNVIPIPNKNNYNASNFIDNPNRFFFETNKLDNNVSAYMNYFSESQNAKITIMNEILNKKILTTKIENSLKIINISSNINDSYSLSFNVSLENVNLNNIIVYKYNLGTWTEYQNFNIDEEEKYLVFSSADFGIYAFDENNQSNLNTENDKTPTINNDNNYNYNSNINNSANSTELAKNRKDESSGFVIFLIIIIIVLVFASFGSVYYLRYKPKHKIIEFNDKQEIFLKTKEYVLKNKDNFSKDSIKKMLNEVGVEDSIINKVFDEIKNE